MELTFEQHIQNWNQIDGIKPINDPEIIKGFIEFLNGIDDEQDVEWDGEGSYFGKQVTIRKNNRYLTGVRSPLQFEVAYQKDYCVRVYTARHNGFWTPEYIDMKTDMEGYKELETALFNCLRRIFGL